MVCSTSPCTRDIALRLDGFARGGTSLRITAPLGNNTVTALADRGDVVECQGRPAALALTYRTAGPTEAGAGHPAVRRCQGKRRMSSAVNIASSTRPDDDRWIAPTERRTMEELFS